MLTDEVILSHADRKMKFSTFRKCSKCGYVLIITRDIHTKLIGKQAQESIKDANEIADKALSKHRC